MKQKCTPLINVSSPHQSDYSSGVDTLSVDYKQAAHDWQARGFTVVPLKPGTKHPAVKWKNGNWLAELKADHHAAIERHFTRGREVGAIVDCGLFILDADSPEAVAALWRIEEAHGVVPLMIVTTSKGQHHYFRRGPDTYAMQVGLSTEQHPAGIDVRTARTLTEGRSIIVLPPSTGKYLGTPQVSSIHDLLEIDQAFIDAVFLHNGMEAPRPRTVTALRRDIGECFGAPPPPPPIDSETWAVLNCIEPNMDYQDWMRVCFGLHNHYQGSDAGYAIFDRWCRRDEGSYPGPVATRAKWRSCNADGATTWASVVSMARARGIEQRLQDGPIVAALLATATQDNVGLAFAERCRGEYVFLHGHGKWARWDGTRWCIDTLGSAREEVRRLARAHNIKSHAQCASLSFVNGALGLAQSDPRFAREVTNFDQDNYLLNCPDGTYDLRTMICQAHNPEDCITLVTPVSPVQTGGEEFRKFLDDITAGDVDLQLFLQRSLGSCLSGAIEEHWLLFWYGLGRNGKNTLAERVTKAMGEYAGVIPTSTLMAQKNPEHKTELMSLKGKRLVTSGEVEEGSHWAEARIKELTGDSAISARYMKQDYVTFQRTHKHLLHGNHQPLLTNVDPAIRSRMKVVPFSVSFEGREDNDLVARLDRELGYVLFWLMEGHRAWMAAGKRIGTCEAVQAASAAYYEEQSTVEMWLSECCDIVSEVRANNEWASANDLYSSYTSWMVANGSRPLGDRRFSAKMQSLGHPKVMSNGARYRQGVVLKNTQVVVAAFAPNEVEHLRAQ